MMYSDIPQRVSTYCCIGVFVVMQLNNEEIIKTVLLACIGGGSSYVVTYLLKRFLDYLRKRYPFKL